MKKLLLAVLCAAALGIADAEETDIVVIGSGGAGMSAALTAAQAGKKVIILEKMPVIGGNSNRSEGGMNAAGTLQQLAHGVTDDSPERMSADMQKGGHYLNNPELTLVLAQNAKDAEQWLLSLGANLCHRMGRGGGQTAAREHGPCDGSAVGAELMKVLYKNAKEIPTIDIRPKNQATDLIVEDGKVVGVKVKTNDKDQKEYTIDAKAVVLATGGFGANAKMIEELRPEYKGFATTNHAGALGEGLDLAKQAGATFVDLREIQAHPTVVPKKGILISESMRARGAYLVNKDGNRFINELLPRDIVANAVLKQPDGEAWLLMDDALAKKNKLLQGYIHQGLTVSGDNVEQLAKAMNVPVKNLQASIDQYTKAYETKKDEAFGRPEMVAPNNVFPMYAVLITPAIHHTMGGVRINRNAEVIGTTAKPIPGLYAAGEVTGGIHGGNRIGGNAVADIITFGRIAGKNAADSCDKDK
ncbi:MAG: flavocytochrome c [Burkholderiales bacterium]|nr:flavocytochrome c [Burkholderiales bacterium]